MDCGIYCQNNRNDAVINNREVEKMGILSGLKPENVYYYFEEICKIPHGSGNTKMISDYIVSIAKKKNLKYVQDENNNCIIYKDGSKGYEDSATVILQGHMDMVCEKEDGCDIDFENEGLRLKLEDGIISADGTTLGGDDGIAVAYMLAILDSDEYVHPPLECVFTVDEEIGMLGAASIDMSAIKGRTMINLDSEEEGYLLVSCAGGETSTVHLPYTVIDEEADTFRITVTGLEGGHSGAEIDKGRANANMLLGRVLNNIRKSDNSPRIVSVNGGLKDNAIPRSSQAVLVTSNPDMLEKVSKNLEKILKNEYSITDKSVRILIEKGERDYPMDEKSTARVIAALVNLPNGIFNMSFDMPGLVQTSLNLGILKTDREKNEVTCSYSVRSSINTQKEELVQKLESLAEVLGGYVTNMGEYPAWEYNKNSRLRDIMTDEYRKLFGKDMIVMSMHAGVECGLFGGGLAGLDAVSIGPDMKDIHTPRETMQAESVKRTWEYLLHVLERLK